MATDRRAPMRAGTAVSTATTTTVPITTATSHQIGGVVTTEPALCRTAFTSPKPPGMPSRAPISAGSTCAPDSPALTCPGVAPSARATAEERRASTTIAQVIRSALTATVPVGDDPDAVVVDPRTHTIYVTNDGRVGSPSNTVSVISGRANTVTATITVGDDPVAVAAYPKTHTGYVANNGDDTVSVLGPCPR
jgi:YVTN family beta-propeller protein